MKQLPAEDDSKNANRFKFSNNGASRGKGGDRAFGDPADTLKKADVRRDASPQVLAAGDKNNGKDAAVDEPFLLVVVEMTSNERRPDLLYKSLYNNQIREQQSPPKDAEKSASFFDQVAAGAGDHQNRKANSDELADDVELVFVEASLGQIQKTLSELGKHKNQILGIRTEVLFDSEGSALSREFSTAVQGNAIAPARSNSAGRIARSAPGAAAPGNAAPKVAPAKKPTPPSAADFDGAKGESNLGNKLSAKKDSFERSKKAKNKDAENESISEDKKRQQISGQRYVEPEASRRNSKAGGDSGIYRRLRPRAIQQYRKEIEKQRLRSAAPTDAKLLIRGADVQTDKADSAAELKTDHRAAFSTETRADPNRTVRVLFVIQFVDNPKANADASKAVPAAKQK